jgi:hypothetical protein
MIQEFVNTWNENKETLRAKWETNPPNDYKTLVTDVVSFMPGMDPKRVHEIDDGDYQGTLVYVIGAQGYQPSKYWCVFVGYGSCSGCDTLQGLWNSSDAERIDGLMTLGLHVVQGIRLMFGGEE